jgi:signal peptidase I
MHRNMKRDTGTSMDLHSQPLSVGMQETDHLVGENAPLVEPQPEVVEEEGQKGLLSPVLREILETVVLAAVIWLLINFTTARYVVEGSSMEPNLVSGQFLIVNRLAYRFGEPQRGDIIVFDFPGNPSDDYVKRIIGLPGEEIRIDQGQVYVNGEMLEEPYLIDGLLTPREGTWTVPEDNYFVMGDNRPSSSDSRTWGTLNADFIVGKAWVSYWPPQEWGVIPHYEFATAGN